MIIAKPAAVDDFYGMLLSERRDWTPTEILAQALLTIKYGVPELIEKVIALSLCLELPVGAWIGAAGTVENSRIPESARRLLLSNIKDESRHERQFKLAAIAHPVREHIQHEAETWADEWIMLPVHTLVKAKDLELGIFLIAQALLRFFGSPALDRMAVDISEDEWRHCRTNLSLCEHLNLVTSLELNMLRKATMAWLVSDLTYPDFDCGFWMRQSDKMIYENEAPEMETLFNWSITNAFFEVGNNRLANYG